MQEAFFNEIDREVQLDAAREEFVQCYELLEGEVFSLEESWCWSAPQPEPVKEASSKPKFEPFILHLDDAA